MISSDGVWQTPDQHSGHVLAPRGSSAAGARVLKQWRAGVAELVSRDPSWL